MHLLTLILSSSLLSTQALALPNFLVSSRGWASGNPNSPQICLTDSQAQTVANNFQTLIANYSPAAANSSLTTTFSDYSDSVNELINNACSTKAPAPLGSATFKSRAEFESGQGAQPAIPFKLLNVWHNCNMVFLRWVSAQTPQQVTGIIAMETVWQKGTGQWLINTVYSEFNSGAWLVNLGVFKPGC